MTRESHDPLAALARQNLAAHYRRLADAAIVAAAELGVDDEVGVDPATHLLTIEQHVDRIMLAHRSHTAVRIGRERAAAARTDATARRRRGEGSPA